MRGFRRCPRTRSSRRTARSLSRLPPQRRVGLRMVEQVPAQEGHLGLGRSLVAAEERLVMPAGHPDELAPGSAVRRPGGGSGQRGLVLVADEDQERAAHPGRVASRPVEPETKGRTGGNLLLPPRVSAAGAECPAAIERVWRAEERDRTRRAGQRYQQRFTGTGTATSDWTGSTPQPSEPLEDPRLLAHQGTPHS